ncbi:MAG TPA: hypothetical protein VG224_08415 [Reyranella sp.]|jgi:hypothetical protein|nr:hypothetical protein [Reyranella sp.]
MKKRSFLVFAVMMTAAGVASAFALGSPEPAARDLPMPVVAKQPAPISVAPAPVVKKASFEARRAPVPLLMKPRPTIEQPIFDADAVGPEVPAKIGDGSGESAAKAAIEADGYKRAKVVRQGDNGLWYAKAMRGTTEVSLTVDAGGRVSLE